MQRHTGQGVQDCLSLLLGGGARVRGGVSTRRGKPAKGGRELPAVKGGRGLPTAKGGRGLPTAKGGRGLPTVKGGRGLPTTKGGRGLPTVTTLHKGLLGTALKVKSTISVDTTTSRVPRPLPQLPLLLC